MVVSALDATRYHSASRGRFVLRSVAAFRCNQHFLDDPYMANSVMSRVTMFRSVITFNLVLIALTWWPGFEGTETRVGAADHLFGWFRILGFRADFAWLILSTVFVLLALVPFLIKAREDHVARINALFCVVEILGFCAFLYRILTAGLLYFG